MRKTVRGVGAALLVAACVPVLAVSPAYADTLSEPAATAGYFHRANVTLSNELPTGALPVQPAKEADTRFFVQPGDLPVAVSAPQQSEKESFLYFTLGDIGSDATINSATLTLPLSEDSQQYAGGAEKVKAIEIDGTGFGDEVASDYASKPNPVEGGIEAPAKAAADGKTYTFDLTALVQKWVTEENNGVGLVPAVMSTPFQVAFQPGTTAKLDVDYTAGAGDEDVLGDATDDAGLDTGLGTGTTDVGSGFDGGTGTAAIDPSLAGGSLDTGVAPEMAPAPDTAAPEAAPAAGVRNVAAVEPSITPDMPFWVGLVFGVLALAFLSLVVGDTRTGRPASASESRIGSALQARRRQGPLTLGAPRTV